MAVNRYDVTVARSLIQGNDNMNGAILMEPWQ